MRRSAGRRSGVMVGLVAAACLLLTGCMRAELGVVVDDDGSGRVDLEVYFDEATLQQSGLTTDDLAKLAETATQSIDGAEVSGVEADGAKGIRLSIPFDDYHQLTQSLTNGQVQGMSTRLFQTFDIAEGDAGHWTMSASVDPVGFRSILSQIPAGLAGSATQIDADTKLGFAVTLPGDVLRSNADSVDGGTARWDLKGDAGPQTFTMENEPSGTSTLQKALIGVGVVLVLGLLVAVAAGGSRRRRRRQGRETAADSSNPTDWAPVAAGSAPPTSQGWGSPPHYPTSGWGQPTPGAPPLPPTAHPPTAPLEPGPSPGAWPPMVAPDPSQGGRPPASVPPPYDGPLPSSAGPPGRPNGSNEPGPDPVPPS